MGHCKQHTARMTCGRSAFSTSTCKTSAAQRLGCIAGAAQLTRMQQLPVLLLCSCSISVTTKHVCRTDCMHARVHGATPAACCCSRAELQRIEGPHSPAHGKTADCDGIALGCWKHQRVHVRWFSHSSKMLAKHSMARQHTWQLLITGVAAVL